MYLDSALPTGVASRGSARDTHHDSDSVLRGRTASIPRKPIARFNNVLSIASQPPG